MSSAHFVLPVRFLDRWPVVRFHVRKGRGGESDREIQDLGNGDTRYTRQPTRIEGTNTTIDLVQRSHAHALQVFTLDSSVFFIL